MDDNYLADDARPVKKYKINFSEKEVDFSELNSHVKKAGEICLLNKSIQHLKLELASEENKKRKDAIDELKNGVFEIDMGDKTNTETQLWVEKFKPKDYFELLSDDGTNRLLLTWIKTWDYIVFGKEKDKPAADKAAEHRAAQKLENNTKKRKWVANQFEADMEEKILDLDEYNRPKIKVALISGPPGLGKTTLAHIIAKRAGYNFIEMNASDDRSAESFRQYIESVTQTRGSVNDSNMKPSCLIIDEIDGAPQNAIQILIDYVQETVKSKKEAKQRSTVLRPIICICNDLYAPSLRQLRQVSIVFQCHQVSTYRLAERLYNICSMSNISCDMDAMIALCDKTSNDIRSSLNTLQFLAKRTNRITSKVIKELNIGQKDMEKSIFSIMNEIFFKKFETKKDFSKIDEPGSKFNSILEITHLCDLDRLIQGLFENFLFIRFRDNYFESVLKAEDWMMLVDKMNRIMRDNQDFSLYNYQKFLAPLFHYLFSSTNSQVNNATKKLKFPSKQYENYLVSNKNTRILNSFLNDMNASTRVFYNSCLYSSIDLIPYLHQIVQPNIRPVAIQLLTKTEKERFENLIRIMIAFSLNYRQEKGTDGQFGFVLEPAIEEIVKLTGMKQHKQMCYIIKQQLAREIAITKVKSIDKNRGDSSKPTTTVTTTVHDPPTKAPSTPTVLRSLNVKDLNKSRMLEQNKDVNSLVQKKPIKESCGIQSFFTKLPSKFQNKASQDLKDKQEIKKNSDGIFLKYKEGYINAVRYNIKISQLI